MWAVMALTIAMNIFGIRIVPTSRVSLVYVISSFSLLLMPLVYLAPQSPAAFVFATFENNGGWKEDGISWCIGLLTVTFPFVSE